MSRSGRQAAASGGWRIAPGRGFDVVEGWLAALGSGTGGGRRAAALATAGRLGWLRNRLSRTWPSPLQVAALYPGCDRRTAARTAWAIGALEGRNRLLVELLRRRGTAGVRSLVRTAPAWAALRPPAILCTFHIGAMQALGAALERLPAPVVAYRLGAPLGGTGPSLQVISTLGDEQARASAFCRGLDQLRRGGFVAMAIDLPAGPALPACCLGRPLPLARGAFALARRSGAPLLPAVARWRAGVIDVRVDAPWPAAGDDGAAAAAAGAWLDRYLRATPADLSLALLRQLLGAA